MSSSAKPSGKAFVHFGMPKTGSTSIQRTLYRYFRKPRETWCHLGLGLGPSANKFIDMVFRAQLPNGFENIMKKYSLSSDELTARVNELDHIFSQNLQQIGSRTALLTSEGIPGLDLSKLSELHRRIADAGLEPRAVGYIRAPKGYIESNFQENIKSGRGDFNFAALFPRYKERFERLETAFGRENVDFWAFDPKTFVNGCVVQDFCSRIQLKIPERAVVRANDGISLQALTLLYTYRKFMSAKMGSKFSPSGILLVKKLRKLDGGKLRFHSSLIEPLVEDGQDQIQWMEERLGASLAEDMRRDDATAIKSEEDLLKYAPEALQWLADNLLDEVVAKRVLSGDPQDVAKGVYQMELELGLPR